jgi:hypothetical protein
MEKKLPEKWKKHIRKMTEYAQKSEQMRKELEVYLTSKGFSEEESSVTGCDFEDSIIDCMQSGQGEPLILEIENALNGRDRLAGSRLDGFE